MFPLVKTLNTGSIPEGKNCESVELLYLSKNWAKENAIEK